MITAGAGITIGLALYEEPDLRVAGFLAGAIGQIASVCSVLLVLLGVEIAVGGVLNVCVLCQLFGLPFQGRDSAHTA